MCTGVEIGYVIAAAGAAASAVNKNQALRRKDKELARGIIEQGKLDKEAAARLQREISELETSGPEQDRKEAQDAFRSALRENQDLAESAAQGVPGASERFAENVAAGKAQIQGKASARAGLLSRIDAPIRQRQREGLKAGRLAGDFSNINTRRDSAAFLARLRASEQVPNPFIDAGAQFAQSFGAAKATRGAPSAPPDPFNPDNLTAPPFDPLDPQRQ